MTYPTHYALNDTIPVGMDTHLPELIACCVLLCIAGICGVIIYNLKKHK